MCSEQEPHRVTATPQAHADQPRARRKYCRSGIDPFGEPGPRPLVLPADATRRNQQNLTWPAAYNEPLLEYYVPLPRCPSGAWTSGWAGYCGCAHAGPTRPARCLTGTDGLSGRRSLAGLKAGRQAAADRGWAVLVPSSFGSLGPNGHGSCSRGRQGPRLRPVGIVRTCLVSCPYVAPVTTAAFPARRPDPGSRLRRDLVPGPFAARCLAGSAFALAGSSSRSSVTVLGPAPLPAIAAAIRSRASFSGEADRENRWTSVAAGDQP